eukprot:UN05118
MASTMDEKTVVMDTVPGPGHLRMNSTLGGQQVGQLKIAFNLFDKDQNGVIDLDELQTVLKTLGQNIGKQEIEDMIASVDQDDDGKIDFDEFITMMENRMFLPSNTFEYQDAFKFFDKNGDGFIDFNELKDVLLSLGEEFTNQDIQDMIDEADTTGNGKVEFDEFINMMPSNMQFNFEKCKEREFEKKAIEIGGDEATVTGNDKPEQQEEDQSNSFVAAGKPTKR